MQKFARACGRSWSLDLLSNHDRICEALPFIVQYSAMVNFLILFDPLQTRKLENCVLGGAIPSMVSLKNVPIPFCHPGDLFQALCR